MNYKQAYNKIIDAYFKDEIQPNNPKFCFCGTLCGDNSWYLAFFFTLKIDAEYTPKEYTNMEKALFSAFPETLHHVYRGNPYLPLTKSFIPDYEEKLFNGMSAALDVLKQIHKDRGEDVEETIFTKRELVNQ